MAYIYADNVVEESTTTTTGAYQLGGVPSTGQAPGARIWVAGVGNGNTSDYYAYEVSGTAWERGLGTVTDATPDTLTRTTVYTSSNANAAVDWTGKTVRIRCVQDARQLMGRDSAHMVENLTIVASRAGNAETIAIKTAAGADPTPGDPVRIAFRNATAGTGDFSVLEVTAAASIVLSSGSSLGAANATAFRVWLVGFNDGGTFRLGAIKCALTDGIYGLQDNVLDSSTAEGGAGGADSAGVFYTSAAVAAKAMRVLAYLEYTLAAAGTWDTAPTILQLYSNGDRLPGALIQRRKISSGAYAAGAGTIPSDNSKPQNTEGTEFLAQDITPRSAANLLQIESALHCDSPSNDNLCLALFRDATLDALAASTENNAGAEFRRAMHLDHSLLAGSTASTTFKLRAGGSASAARLNSGGGAAAMGGVLASYLAISEVLT